MRRTKFSEKYGYSELRNTFQINNIDSRLKSRIWNRIREDIFSRITKSAGGSYFYYNREHQMFISLYDEYFGIDIKPTENISNLSKQIKDYYEKAKWYQIYDLLEALVFYHYDEKIKEYFKKNINKTLEEEMSAYRFVDNCIAAIVDEVEIQEIEDVFKSQYDSVRGHLAKALEFLSDRESPDFQNSIKESITAVESMAKIISKKETDLASCLKGMDLDLNKQFVTGMNNIYGWTCKEDGIRHAHTGEKLKTGFDEAKYMLVSCSAFINYLISKNNGNKTT